MRLMDTTRRRRSASWLTPRTARAASGVVVSFPRTAGEKPQGHECVTRKALAEKLAKLKGYDYGGDYDPEGSYEGALYFVPGDTLIGVDAAKALGVRCEDDLFGGLVPFPFVGTKSITHPLADGEAHAPMGWSPTFPRAVRHAVLPGRSAFSIEDAKRAGRRLLRSGAVRVKPALGVGGRGQTVVRDAAELDAAVGALDAAELVAYGVALEQHMTDVTTLSVGQVRVGGLIATYFGTQKLARDNGGATVYGGSDLTVARGDFDALLALEVDDAASLAIEQARTYDAAAQRCFRGFLASRRNYDIARGRDAKGELCSGVLEQSWRIGGASGAEVAALEAFRADPALNAVRAECSEIYGEGAAPAPRTAAIYFCGVDPDVGYITKYTTLEPYADA